MRLHEESGFSLTELLVAMSLMMVVLSATLTTFDIFVNTNQRNNKENDMRETARVGVDSLAKELRNAGARTDEQSPVERAEPRDIVFDDVEPDPDPAAPGAGDENVRRVRYCLQESTPKTGSLWRQEQAWVPALPAVSTPCPDAAYGSQELVAGGIVNHAVERDGVNPPVFNYDQTDLTQLTTIGAELFVDTDVDREPGTTELSTSVRIRNRNRPPTASFSSSFGGNRHVLLNAGDSSDPEGQQLEYEWTCAKAGVPCVYDPIDGQVVDYQVATAGTYIFTLTVTDPGSLTATSTQSVIVP